VLVQIYEVQTPEEAAALARLGVDHIGVLVGEGAFPRELPPARARAIFAATPRGARRVALSLSADAREIARVIEQTRPDIIHIGAAVELFSVEHTRELKAIFPQARIMRSIPVTGAASIGYAKAYEGVADFLLLDSHDPGDRQIGGLGRTHDWSISRRIVEAVSVPAILAGGLDADNVGAAIAAVGPAGVDSKTKTDRAEDSGRTSTRSAGLSPPRSSPAEGCRPQLNGAVILDDAQQLEPALQPRRATLTLVVLRFGDVLRVPNDRLAAVGGARQRHPWF
jgi:phosphoribosylanthranilate isomerase